MHNVSSDFNTSFQTVHTFTTCISHAYIHVRTIVLAMCLCTQNVATPTTILNFCEENFRDQKSNHEIHENIVPRKFGAIRYNVAGNIGGD